MKKLLVLLVMISAFLGVEVSYGQRPVDHKSSGGGASPREFKSDDRREELSKKLMQRKMELRREDHVVAKGPRGNDVREKEPEPKKK